MNTSWKSGIVALRFFLNRNPMAGSFGPRRRAHLESTDAATIV
jgi:hypothetical protein